jgi:hypothetical protein
MRIFEHAFQALLATLALLMLAQLLVGTAALQFAPCAELAAIKRVRDSAMRDKSLYLNSRFTLYRASSGCGMCEG